MQIRKASAADIPAMMAIDQENTTAAHWSRSQYGGFLSPGSPRSSERFVLVVEDMDDQGPSSSAGSSPILGFLVAHRVDADWELENIVVTRQTQRNGLGTRLLEQFINHVRENSGRNIFLEVRESNHAARELYRRANFKETGIRKDYYSDPPESAVLSALIVS